MLVAEGPLQFGVRLPGQDYADRSAAFGVAALGGRIAVVRVTRAGEPPYFDLPGGGIDGSESEAQALIREFGEETGLLVRAGELVTRADQYMINAEDQPFLSQGAFYEAILASERPELKIEDDHALVWLKPNEALPRLRHDSHAWAVSAWLRSRIPLR
jgi:8-oxo-dGTP diphosphatase